MPRGGALLGALVCLPLAGCSFVLDFSAELDADSPTNDGADGADPCGQFEPNESLAAAVTITPGTYSLGICPTGEDRDFLGFALLANQDVTIQIDFVNDNSEGDLDMRLYASIDGTVISVSEGFGNSEMIAHTAAGGDQLTAGSYVIEVFPFAPTIQNTYTLQLTITDGPIPDAGPPDAPPV